MGRNSTARNKEILDMYQNGMSYQEIANHFGISRQRAYSIVYNYFYTTGERKWEVQIKKIIYPNIRKWMLENQMPIYKLSEIVKPEFYSAVALTRFLTEKRVRVEISTINKLLKIFDMTFEEAFSTAEED